MKKINLRGISEILNEKELKNVMGGCESTDGCDACKGKKQYDDCVCPTITGYCRYAPFCYNLICGW